MVSVERLRAVEYRVDVESKPSYKLEAATQDLESEFGSKSEAKTENGRVQTTGFLAGASFCAHRPSSFRRRRRRLGSRVIRLLPLVFCCSTGN